MNKHMLLVMKWLNDPTSVTQTELEQNRKEANRDVHAVGGDAAYDAAYAAANGGRAEKWVARYFNCTGEDRQHYVDALATATPTPPDTLPTNGQKLRHKCHTITFIGLSPACSQWICYNHHDSLGYYSPDECTPMSPEGEAMQAIIDGAADPVLALLEAGYHL